MLDDSSPPPAGPFSRQSSLGYQVNHLARLLERTLRLRIAEYGVVPGQFPALLALYERDGQTQAELCQLVRIEQPTMANTLNRMQRDGLIVREPDPSDGRRSLIRLTARARDLESRLVAVADEVNEVATGGLDTDQVHALMAAVSLAIANLEAVANRDVVANRPFIDPRSPSCPRAQ